MEYELNRYKTEFYNEFSFSIEDKIRSLVGEVCFYKGDKKGMRIMQKKETALKCKSPLHPKNVDPDNKEQIERYFRETMVHAEILKESPISPFASPIVQRTYTE